jgi:hypothetical protein
MGNKTIRIPNELEEVWYKIPNRSAWITRMLLEMEPIAVQEEHKAWSSGLSMCNLKHKRGVCKLCLKELDMSESDAIDEYFRRTEHYQKGWPKYWEESA